MYDQYPEVAKEPSPEFDASCVAIFRSWESGDVPFLEAIAQLNARRDEAVAMNHIANHGRAEQLLGNIQHYHGNLTTSVQHWERARRLYAQINNRTRVAGIDLNIGESYRFRGDFSRSLRMYRIAYNIAEEGGDHRLQTIASSNEGLVLVMMKQYTSARKAFERALHLIHTTWPADNRVEMVSLLCEIHHGMATVHLQEGNLVAAWEQAAQALGLTQNEGQPMDRGYANRIAGEVITRMGYSPDPHWPDDPDGYFRIALEAFREVNAEAELARTMFAQAISLAARGRKTTAARKLQQVMIIFSRLGMIDDAARAAEAQLSVTVS